MDTIDKELIQLLEKDARQSSRVLAEKLNISPTNVRRRIGKLIRDKVIRIVAFVDPTKVGFPLGVVVSLDVELEKLGDAINFLDARPEVRVLATTTGLFNISATCQFLSMEDLSEFTRNELSKIKGVRRSEIAMIMRREKAHYLFGVL